MFGDNRPNTRTMIDVRDPVNGAYVQKLSQQHLKETENPFLIGEGDFGQEN